jgi:ferric-dicitrate binding protein FerR (iron transport regulator)
MSVTNHSRFEELVSRYLDDALTGTDTAELKALLAEPPLAERFLEMTRLNSQIAGLLSAPVPDSAMVELVRMDIAQGLSAAQPLTGPRLRVVERTNPQKEVVSPIFSALCPLPQRRKPLLRALAIAAVFMVFAGLAAIFFVNRTQLAEAPAVASLAGEVRLIGPKGDHALIPGQSWQRGETLKTVGPKSTVTVTFSDGSRLAMGDNCLVLNQSTKEQGRFELQHGTVQGALKKQPAGHAFVFITPEAEAIVVGTTFQIFTGGHRARLEVTEGEVRLRRRQDGTEVTIKDGHYAVVAPNTPLVATPFHPNPHSVH